MEDRTEWLVIALEEVGDLPSEVLYASCRAARRSCGHPAKLLPAIIAHAEPAVETLRTLVRVQHHSVDALSGPRSSHLSLVRDVPPPLTQEAVDAMPEALRAIGLGCGALIQDDDGSLRPAPAA